MRATIVRYLPSVEKNQFTFGLLFSRELKIKFNYRSEVSKCLPQDFCIKMNDLKNITEYIVELCFILDSDISIDNLFKELPFRRVGYMFQLSWCSLADNFFAIIFCFVIFASLIYCNYPN